MWRVSLLEPRPFKLRPGFLLFFNVVAGIMTVS